MTGTVGALTLELLQPACEGGGLAEFVRDMGAGPFVITLGVPNVDRGVLALRERGTHVGKATPGAGRRS